MEMRQDQRCQPVEEMLRLGHDLLRPSTHQRDLVVIQCEAVEDDGDEDESGVRRAEERQASHNPQALPVQPTHPPGADAGLKVESISCPRARGRLEPGSFQPVSPVSSTYVAHGGSCEAGFM